MPDRRQHDRREGSGLQGKKLSINLVTFIMICIIFVLLLVSIVLCVYFRKSGYTSGFNEGYNTGNKTGYADGYTDGYYDCYIDTFTGDYDLSLSDEYDEISND